MELILGKDATCTTIELGSLKHEVNVIFYLYHKVITRFVRFPLWSLENDRASPKSASFKIPSLFIRRLAPARNRCSWM